MVKTSKEDAKRMLSNAAPEKAFWVNNGPVLRGIAELASAARKLSAQQFIHHVNSGRNDFAKWVDEVVKDSELARKLRQAKTKDDFARALTNRLKQLQKLIQ